MFRCERCAGEFGANLSGNGSRCRPCFLIGNSNLVSIVDVDAGTSDVSVTLTATHGVLTLGGTTGLIFTFGDGTNDGTMTFAGTVSEVNAALVGLTFSPTASFYRARLFGNRDERLGQYWFGRHSHG